MNIVVAAHGRFHAFRLARELHVRRNLSALLTTYPGIWVRGHVGPCRIVSTARLEARRRLGSWLSVARISDYELASRFGSFVRNNLPSDTQLLVGWSGATLEAVCRAREMGAKVVIERGSTHIVHQARVLAREYSEFEIAGHAVDPRMIEREVREYDLADAIAVPSRAAADTFLAYGVSPERLIVNPYGADITARPPSEKKTNGKPVRILFVGAVSLRKGVPWLLRAFAKVRPAAELHLVGPMDRTAAGVIGRESLDRVTLVGPLHRSSLDKAFADADIFCLPSLEEGLSLAVLEAMGAGLPVVVTRETGASDLIDHGREGLIVPARDPDSLASALETLILDSEMRQSMGRAAKLRIQRDSTWHDYGGRAVANYRRLLGLPTLTPAEAEQCAI